MRDHDRQLRDVVALSTLPAMWLGGDPARVAESLAAALFTTVGADLVYVGLDCADGELWQAAQVGRYEVSPSVARELGPAIREWAQSHGPEEPLLVPNPLGTGTMQISARPLAFEAECGAVAAGFSGERMPDTFQHLLLNVAATQATTAVRHIRLLRSLRRNIADRERSEARERQSSEELEELHRVARTLAGELELDKLLQGITDAATRLSGARFGAFFYNSQDERGESYLLYTLSGAPREAFERLGMLRNTPLFDQTFRGTGIVRLDDVRHDPRYGRLAPHYGMPKGHLPVRSYLAVPVVSRSRAVLGGLFLGHPEPGVFTERSERMAAGIAAYASVAIDNARLYAQAQKEIAERERAVETQRLLIGELNHRVKNTLATVQAIAQQTLRQADSPEAFVASFTGRLQALSRVHTILTESNWQGTDLKRLICEQLLIDALGEERLTVEGPTVELDPQLTLHLALMLHELGTNSQKYGALTREGGAIRLTWTVSDGMLRLKWCETGAPAMTTPMRRGFGSRLMEQIAKGRGGHARMIVGNGGIAWEISLPLRRDANPAMAGMAEPMSGAEQAIAKRILVVEDESLVGLDLVATLRAAGFEAIGPAARVEEALHIVNSQPIDGAVLDANLDGRPVDEIAAALERRKIPFVFVTGYSREYLPAAFRDRPVLSKPLVHSELMEIIPRLLSTPAAAESASPRSEQHGPSPSQVRTGNVLHSA
jgi:two-component sensor histidine kinase/CheY-like chemotaxis protein